MLAYLKTILCGILFSSSIFTLLVTVYLHKKHSAATRYFSLFCLGITFYSFGYAMELYSVTLGGMLFWSLIQYIGVPFLPAFWIIFSLEYNNRQTSLLTKLSILLIPILTFIFRYTSPLNQLFYAKVELTSNPYFSVLYIEKGPWYWVQALFVTSCFLVSNYLYLNMYRKMAGAIRQQGLLMVIASFLPWVSLILDLLNISPLHIDYGPFALTSSVVLFFIAFVRYQFLNIKPLARDKIFESTNDGIIVLDAGYRIIDYNPSAAAICSDLRDDVIGADIRETLPEHNGLTHSVLYCTPAQFDVPEPKGSYKVNTVKIQEPHHREVGYIITLTDITKYMDMMAELNNLASKDPLTGVFNRRHFVELSLSELENSKRGHHPLSMIILDLDFFKQVNDHFGHQAGDVVLKEVASICRTSIRLTDILGRYGGEEFVVLLPETTLEDCRVIAERILTNIAEAEILFEGRPIKITTSIGITGVTSATVESLDDFLKYADKALYLAKSQGRNCVRSITASVISSV